MKILGIQDITEAETIRQHVEAGGTVAADGTLEPPRDALQGEAGSRGTAMPEGAVEAVASALAKPPVTVNVAAYGLAAELQVKAQGLEAEIGVLEHAIEAMTAQLSDKLKARAICAAALRSYHEAK